MQRSISSEKYRKKQGTTFHSVEQYHLQSKLKAFLSLFISSKQLCFNKNQISIKVLITSGNS